MKFILIIFFIWVSFSGISQQSKNVTLLSHIPLNEESSDIWGYTDENGLEYVIIGVLSGLKIYSLENPQTPKLIQHIDADRSIWRDIKSFGKNLYSVADQGNDGLLVVDMSMAPDSITWDFNNLKIDFEKLNGEIKTCHNLYIDSTGYLFLAGCNLGSKGVIICQIFNDSSEIMPIGYTNEFYTHDVFVNHNNMYSSDILAGQLSIYDISDKAKPLLISSIQTGNSFTHNAWTNKDNSIVFTTDEVEGAYVEAYNIEELDNIQFQDRIRSNRIKNPKVIVHNVHFHNGYLITSHYTEGVIIVDAQEPDNLIEIGYFDPFDNEDNISGRWFDGCWGAFPYFASGIIAISDISNGLYILKPDYINAAKIKGFVTDKNSNEPIRNASIHFLNREDLIEFTDLNGEFRTGSSNGGNETLIIDHPLYDRKEIKLDLMPGSNEELKIQLSSVTLSANITDGNKNPAFDIKLKIIDDLSQNSVVIDNIDHTFTTPISSTKTYTLIFSRWGKREKIIEHFNVSDHTSLDIILLEGYEDSFTFDNGWIKETFASSGSWQRGTPTAKSFGNILLQPNFDSPFDIGNDCYFTGLNGGGSNSGDVDNGYVVLKSPDISLKPNITYDISIDYWFSNERGSVTPNDSLTFNLVLPQIKIRLGTITTSDQKWRNFNRNIELANIQTSDQVYLEIIAFDLTPQDHVVEAGIDNIKIIENSAVSNKNLNSSDFKVYPNPFKNSIYIKSADNNELHILIYDLNGRLIQYIQEINSETSINLSNLQNGIYLMKIISKTENSVFVKKIIKN